MSETLAERFASTEITSLALTDALVGIGDRTGTPKYGLVQITPLQTLLNAATATLTNKTFTLPQINDTSSDHQYVFAVSELASDRTVTLPLLAGNDEFVFKDHAVTLTNKTLTSPIMTGPIMTVPQIQDTSSDHQYIFAVSELAADRTVTLPLLTGDDEWVFKDHAVTLTNKTLTSPVLTTPQINDTSSDHQYVFAVSELASDRTVTLPLLTGNDTFTFNDFAATLKNKTFGTGCSFSDPVETFESTGIDDNASSTALTIDSSENASWVGNVEALANKGTVGTGTTAKEYGDGFNHVTVLTMAGTLPSITGDTAQSVGLLLYTLPDGVCRVKSVHMDVGITQSQGNIDADTPKVGIGSLIAATAVAVLNGTTEFDDYVVEQEASNCTGAVTDKSEDTSPAGLKLIEDGGGKTIFFNAADGWAAAAGGDTAATLSGTVTIEWTFLGA